MKPIRFVLTVVFLTVGIAGFGLAQEMKQDMKKDVKKEMKEMKEMKDEGKMTMQSFECACGFKVTSMDGKEAMDMGKMHAKNKHMKELSDEDAKKMMKSGKEMMKKEMKKDMH